MTSTERSADSGSRFTLNPEVTPVALPTPKSQEMVLVRRSEIESLKRGVRRAFENPVENASTWAGIWLGVAVTALFSLVALVSVKDNKVNDYVISGHVAAIVSGIFLAGFLAYIHRKTRTNSKSGHEDVIKDLDELLERAPTQVVDDDA
jgi:hypothetical protein